MDDDVCTGDCFSDEPLIIMAFVRANGDIVVGEVGLLCRGLLLSLMALLCGFTGLCIKFDTCV